MRGRRRRWESRRASAGPWRAGGRRFLPPPLSPAAGRGPLKDRCGRGLGGEDGSEGVREGRGFNGPTVCVLRPSTPRIPSGDFFKMGFGTLMTGGGFLRVSVPPPPGFSSCKACFRRGWEVNRGCGRDVVCGIQTMSAWASLHPVELRAAGSPAQAAPSLSVRPGEPNTIKFSLSWCKK